MQLSRAHSQRDPQVCADWADSVNPNPEGDKKFVLPSANFPQALVEPHPQVRGHHVQSESFGCPKWGSYDYDYDYPMFLLGSVV